MHIKTVILLRNVSFGFINFVNLSTSFFIQLFLTFLYFFIKNAFLRFFLFLRLTFFYIYAYYMSTPCPNSKYATDPLLLSTYVHIRSTFLVDAHMPSTKIQVFLETVMIFRA